MGRIIYATDLQHIRTNDKDKFNVILITIITQSIPPSPETDKLTEVLQIHCPLVFLQLTTVNAPCFSAMLSATDRFTADQSAK